MKNGERLLLLLNDLSAAISSFEGSLLIDLARYDELERDVFKNGQIQKFEYSVELLWKVVKKFLEVKRESVVLYPKDALKAFFSEDAINERTYLVLMDAIQSRNLLSHVYKARSSIRFIQN